MMLEFQVINFLLMMKRTKIIIETGMLSGVTSNIDKIANIRL